LVEPTGVNRQMNQPQIGVLPLQSLAGGLSSVRRAVVHNPEHAFGLPVRFLTHDLRYQPIKRSDASGRVAAAKDFGAPDISGRQIGQSATALVFKLNPHALARLGGFGGMNADAGLNTGLLVG